jgi:hypothetical protein
VLAQWLGHQLARVFRVLARRVGRMTVGVLLMLGHWLVPLLFLIDLFYHVLFLHFPKGFIDANLRLWAFIKFAPRGQIVVSTDHKTFKQCNLSFRNPCGKPLEG